MSGGGISVHRYLGGLALCREPLGVNILESAIGYGLVHLHELKTRESLVHYIFGRFLAGFLLGLISRSI